MIENDLLIWRYQVKAHILYSALMAAEQTLAIYADRTLWQKDSIGRDSVWVPTGLDPDVYFGGRMAEESLDMLKDFRKQLQMIGGDSGQAEPS